MKALKILAILALLPAALLVIGAPASARSLADSGITFINGVFASGSGAAPLASTNYRMQAVVGEAGLPDGATDLSSVHYRHQPGFLPASVSSPTPIPTSTPTPTRTPTRLPTITRTPTRVSAVVTVQSTGAQDGWVLESAENSNVGGAINSTGNLYLGDDATRKQYRSLLSFNTGSLPDNAVITAVTLKVRQQAVVGGGSPATMFQGFMVDIKKGFFGTIALQATDFQTPASKTYGPFNTTLVGGWYSINLTTGKAYINKLATSAGLTQMRLRFKLDDNNNAIANYLSLYSGNAPAASRPQLVIKYYTP